MREKQTSNKRPIEYKKLIIVFVILAVVCAGIVFAGQQVIRMIEGHSPEQQVEATDELKRARHFISDWFNENLDSGSDCEVYFNELKFNETGYTLTYAGGRLRAVYERGERFFKFYLLNKAEFFEVGGKIRCRLYYLGSEEYTFPLE